MERNRAVALFIGVVVSIPLLVAYQMGVFPSMEEWIAATMQRMLVLPVDGVSMNVPLQYAFYTVMAFASAWIGLEVLSQWRRIAFMIGMSFLTVTLSAALAFNGVLFEPFSGIIAVVVACCIGMAASSGLSGVRRHLLRSFFVGRLTSDGFEKLAREVKPTDLTSRREVTVLTIRLLNYADLAAEMEASEFEACVSYFQKRASEMLVLNDGYLDSCNAQRVRGVFGFPMESEKHASEAAIAALAMNKSLVDLAKEIEERWKEKARFGLALASGSVVSGLYGYDDFQSFSVVGDAVGFSDRLCSLNTAYGSRILMDAKAYSKAKEALEVRPMEMVFVEREGKVSEVYEVLSIHGGLKEKAAKARDAFWQGVVQFRKGDLKESLKSFEKAKIEGEDDAPLEYFIEMVKKAQKDASPEGVEAKPSKGAKHARSLKTS